MANYTATDIKALRERTGAGMLDVKRALDEADGDADKALELIRVKGLKGVTKREGRSASDGLVAADVSATPDGEGEVGVLVEVRGRLCGVHESGRDLREVPERGPELPRGAIPLRRAVPQSQVSGAG